MVSSTTIYGTHCGTGLVAKSLGISVGSVFKLIHSGELHSWRTKGGHHRIPLSSLARYLSELGLPTSKIMINARQSFRVMIIEDDENNQELFKLELSHCGINPVIHKSGPTALLEIALFRPQVLLVNAGIANLNFFELIKVLSDRHGSKIQIIATINSGSVDRVMDYSSRGMGVFLFPENKNKLVNYLINFKQKISV